MSGARGREDRPQRVQVIVYRFYEKPAAIRPLVFHMVNNAKNVFEFDHKYLN
jgi:hypothetical protein